MKGPSHNSITWLNGIPRWTRLSIIVVWRRSFNLSHHCPLQFDPLRLLSHTICIIMDPVFSTYCNYSVQYHDNWFKTLVWMSLQSRMTVLLKLFKVDVLFILRILYSRWYIVFTVLCKRKCVNHFHRCCN